MKRDAALPAVDFYCDSQSCTPMAASAERSSHVTVHRRFDWGPAKKNAYRAAVVATVSAHFAYLIYLPSGGFLAGLEPLCSIY
jgi:hypothetical protein